MLLDTPSTDVHPWLYLVSALLGGLFSGGLLVAIYNSIVNKRRERKQTENTEADTELKRLQQAKTMTEMLAIVTDELNGTLKAQKGNTERMRAMQMQMDTMQTKLARFDDMERELAIANTQVERARRAGFLSDPDRKSFAEGGAGNPAAGEA